MILIFMAILIAPSIIGGITDSETFKEICYNLNPTMAFFQNIGAILTSENSKNEAYAPIVYWRFMYFILQTLIFMSFTIMIDDR